MSDLSTRPEAFISTAELAGAVLRGVKSGRLRKLGSRLYTRNLTDPPERIVSRNLWQLVASYLPGALIADRTALEVFASDGLVYIPFPVIPKPDDKTVIFGVAAGKVRLERLVVNELNSIWKK